MNKFPTNLQMLEFYLQLYLKDLRNSHLKSLSLLELINHLPRFRGNKFHTFRSSTNRPSPRLGVPWRRHRWSPVTVARVPVDHPSVKSYRARSNGCPPPRPGPKNLSESRCLAVPFVVVVCKLGFSWVKSGAFFEGSDIWFLYPQKKGDGENKTSRFQEKDP